MIVAGDEFGRTQGGNNNGYAQDNEVTWLDWEHADAGLIAFTARLADLRRSHPALAADAFLSGRAEGSALPDVVWRREGRRGDGGARLERPRSPPPRHGPRRARAGRHGPARAGLSQRRAVTTPRSDCRNRSPGGDGSSTSSRIGRASSPDRSTTGAGFVVKARSVFVLVEQAAED